MTNKAIVTLVLSLASLVPWKNLSADEAKSTSVSISWSRLAPQNGKPYNDPFSKLTSGQLADISYVVRVRRLIEENKIAADGVDAAAAAKLTRKLATQQIDVGWLMQQRDRVRELRSIQLEAAAQSIAQAYKSKSVVIKGFATPIRDEQGKVTQILVVPTTELCRHATPPSPLCVVWVTPTHEFSLIRPGSPVIVRGNLRAVSKTTPMVTANGVQSYRSAYKLVSATIHQAKTNKKNIKP